MSNIQRTIQELLHDANERVAELTGRRFEAGPREGLAAKLYCERRRREHWFKRGMFWEPAWDLLLYLYDAAESGVSSVTVDHIAQASIAVSDDSAGRWIDLLTSSGYIKVLERPGSDGLIEVSLTQLGRDAMAGYLRESQVITYQL